MIGKPRRHFHGERLIVRDRHAARRDDDNVGSRDALEESQRRLQRANVPLAADAVNERFGAHGSMAGRGRGPAIQVIVAVVLS